MRHFMDGFRQPKRGLWRLEWLNFQSGLPNPPHFRIPWKALGATVLFLGLGHLLPWDWAALYFLPLFGMAQQTLNATAGGPDDNLPTATAKLNSMFGELYALQSSTLNAADPRFAGATDEISINNAITAPNIGAIAVGADRIFIPSSMLPFDISQINVAAFGALGGRLIREGGDYSVYDVTAYGATGNGIANDTYAFNAALTAAANGGGVVSVPCRGQAGYVLGAAGAASATTILEVKGGVTLAGNGGNQLLPVLILQAGANRSMVEVPAGSNQGAKIAHLRLEGNSANQSGTSHGIHGVNSTPGSYMDTRTAYEDLFIHDFRTNGVLTDANFGQGSWRDVIVRNCLAENWLFNGTDNVFVNCQSNNSGTDGFLIQGTFNFLFGCISYAAGQYGFNLAASGKYVRLMGCDSDSSQRDNYKLQADGSILNGCTSRDPGQLTSATYSHIDVASGLTGLNIASTIWKARSLTNTALYLIRCNGALTQSHIEATSWETGAATGGVLLFGALTQVTVVRPLGIQTFASGDATPSVSASGLFNNPSPFATNGSTTITMFDDGQDGQPITVLATGSITIANGGTMQLQGATNFAMVANNTLSLVLISGVWREMGRHT